MQKSNSINVNRKKKTEKEKVIFILFCITIPIIQWLVFYVYTNIDSVFMAFRDTNGSLTLDNFKRFFNEFKSPSSEIRLAFRNTFITFAIILATYPFKVLVSYFLYKKVPGSTVFRILFFLPSILFSVCTAMVFTRFVGTTGFIARAVQDMLHLDYVPELLADSRFANIVVLLNLVWLGFPGDLIIWGGTFARIPVDVLESGKIDGVNWWTEFTKIIVPLVWPTLSLQMILMFCGVFGASGQVFLLTGGNYGTITLSVWMYKIVLQNSGTMYTSNVYNYLSAVGLLITVVAVTLSLCIRRFTDKAFNDVDF